MNCKITKMPPQQFITITRSFPNVTSSTPNANIAKFWDDCYDQGIVDALLNLRPTGRRDLFGLCAPSDGDTFDYGIGVIVDNSTVRFDLAEMEKCGYRLWNVPAGMYVQFDCIGNNGECISDTWVHFRQEFLPQTKYRHREAPDYEVYPENPDDELFCKLWIPIDTP